MEETSSDTGACWNYRLDRGSDRRDYQHSCADRYSACCVDVDSPGNRTETKIRTESRRKI